LVSLAANALGLVYLANRQVQTSEIIAANSIIAFVAQTAIMRRATLFAPLGNQQTQLFIWVPSPHD